ncbi:MAG: HD domain-containing protein [Alphaproteobacteria bacterium]|nr:HD domain-containing protein [Alphaproteobacteria bacterium]
MLDEAMQLLKLQFDQCMEIVGKDPYYRGYAEEKWRHSLQVFGAGNYLVRHVDWLKNKSLSYIEMVRTAVLLHDVCRFTEIAYKFNQDGACDHGVSGATLLKNTPMFHDVRIWLPIKQHGHLIEQIYMDDEYINIEDAKLRREIELICFLIRDADKIANLNMLVHEPKVYHLFFGKSKEDYVPETDGYVSERVQEKAFVETTAPRFAHGTVADYVVGYVSWFMDINYQSAMDYCNKLHLVEALFEMLENYCADESFKSKYAAFVRNYLRKHFFLP